MYSFDSANSLTSIDVLYDFKITANKSKKECYVHFPRKSLSVCLCLIWLNYCKIPYINYVILSVRLWSYLILINWHIFNYQFKYFYFNFPLPSIWANPRSSLKHISYFKAAPQSSKDKLIFSWSNRYATVNCYCLLINYLFQLLVANDFFIIKNHRPLSIINCQTYRNDSKII